jgi:peptidoglycan/LPS O-acetylase OafA/YrhL
MAADHSMHSRPYLRLSAMVLLSFIAMYILMYAMVDELSHVYNNLNQAYMAALMAAPMLIIELLLMRPMYPDKWRNALLIVIGLAVLAGAWILIRQQTAIADRQFLRSMIPHHSGAVLMCEQASISDERLQALCRRIVESQLAEIAEMEALLAQPLDRTGP